MADLRDLFPDRSRWLAFLHTSSPRFLTVFSRPFPLLINLFEVETGDEEAPTVLLRKTNFTVLFAARPRLVFIFQFHPLE